MSGLHVLPAHGSVFFLCYSYQGSECDAVISLHTQCKYICAEYVLHRVGRWKKMDGNLSFSSDISARQGQYLTLLIEHFTEIVPDKGFSEKLNDFLAASPRIDWYLL